MNIAVRRSVGNNKSKGLSTAPSIEKVWEISRKSKLKTNTKKSKTYCGVIIHDRSFIVGTFLSWNQHTCTIPRSRLKTVDGQSLVDFRAIILQDMFIAV